MRLSSYHVLRVGLGIMFAWMGILIFIGAEAWGSLVQPWASGLLPVKMVSLMTAVAIFDIILGIWFVTAIRVRVPALLAAIHIFTVLVVTTGGLDNILVRDIGLLAASLALFLQSN